ncbi:MAG TPA: DUF4337 domain-containing protein [Fimbriimonadaceae bacterium]|jgi:hypothetical protein
MSEEDDLETKDLQEALDELHEEKAEHDADAKKTGWVRYIGLSTAILAVFAAMGALQSGSLINEALINQVKSSDKWNEYQASREKSHLYTVAAQVLVDQPLSAPAAVSNSHAKGKWAPESPKKRARDFEDQVKKEDDKATGLSKEAVELQKETSGQVHRHEFYAYSVALIQVAIALSAIAALARVKYVWYMSMGCGLIGIILFFMGLR